MNPSRFNEQADEENASFRVNVTEGWFVKTLPCVLKTRGVEELLVAQCSSPSCYSCLKKLKILF